MAIIEGTRAATDHISGPLIVAGGVGAAKSVYTAGQIVASINDAENDGITDVLVLKHSTTGTPANGIGVGVSVGLEATDGLLEAASLDFSLTDVSSGSEDAQMELKLVSGGTPTSTIVATGVTVGITATTASTTATSGALTVAGGAGIAKQVYTGGIAVVLSEEDSINADTGSILSKGGIGI